MKKKGRSSEKPKKNREGTSKDGEGPGKNVRRTGEDQEGAERNRNTQPSHGEEA